MRSRGLRFGAAELNLKGGKSLGKHCRLLGFFLTFTHTLLLPVFYFCDVLFLSLYLSFSLSRSPSPFSLILFLLHFSPCFALFIFLSLSLSLSLNLFLFWFFFLISVLLFLYQSLFSLFLSFTLTYLLSSRTHSLSFPPLATLSLALCRSPNLSLARDLRVI